MTREELESRFANYLQEGDAFCARATIRCHQLFGGEALGTNILVKEYGRGPKELVKIYHATADHLDAVRSFEAKAKADYEGAMAALRTKEEAPDASKRDYEEKAITNNNLFEAACVKRFLQSLY